MKFDFYKLACIAFKTMSIPCFCHTMYKYLDDIMEKFFYMKLNKLSPFLKIIRVVFLRLLYYSAYLISHILTNILAYINNRSFFLFILTHILSIN